MLREKFKDKRFVPEKTQREYYTWKYKSYLPMGGSSLKILVEDYVKGVTGVIIGYKPAFPSAVK